jgi:hypothetical protein
MLRCHPSSVFVLKYYAPVILFGGVFVLWSVGFRWAQLIFLFPLEAHTSCEEIPFQVMRDSIVESTNFFKVYRKAL